MTAALRDYQIADLAFYIANPKGMNLSDAGVGKTPSVCVYQYYLWSELGVKSAWVQPKGLMAKNRREILRFTNFKPEDVVILDGTPDQIKKQLASGAKVFLLGFRRWTLSWKDLPSDVRAVQVDEMQKGFKRVTSAACQSLFEAFRTGGFKYFLPMTGTLISGALDTAYPAIHVIEPRYYLSYDDFLRQHAMMDLDGKIVGWLGHAKLREILGRHAIRRTFDEVYGKQEVVIQTEFAEMTAAQRSLYDKFQEDALLELEKFFLTGAEPGVAFIRARQIMEHPNIIPDLTSPGDFVDILKGEMPGKLQLLEQHFEDHLATGDPLLVFSTMVPQQNQILALARKTGLKADLINGSVPMSERDRINKDFDDGKLQCIVLSPACADVGLNLQWSGKRETSHVIMAAAPFLDDVCVQGIRRAVRGTRVSPLRVTFMAYLDSLDERIFYILKRKSVDAHLVDPNRQILDLWKED